MKVKIFKGTTKKVEQHINEFLEPKLIGDKNEEHVEVKMVTQSVFETLQGTDGVIISIYYTTTQVVISSQYSPHLLNL